MTRRTKDKPRRTCDRCRAGRAKVRGLCGACFSTSVRRSISTSTLIVGMAPGEGTASDGPAFVGSKSGRFLADLCGTTDYLLPSRFTLVNLFVDEWQHGTPARDAAAELVRSTIHEHFNLIVLCGRAVATAFRFDGDWFDRDQRKAMVDGRWWPYDRVLIPHPSGLCRVWNEEANREKGRTIMSKIWEDAG